MFGCVILFLCELVYAGRPKTERVGVHIFAETRHATLWTGGVGLGVGGVITSCSMCAKA